MRKPIFIARQGRRPTGLLGYIVAWVMAKETAPENTRTLDILDIAMHDKVLEIGCGHGATLDAAAGRNPHAKFVGIDFSEVMINVARQRNRWHLSNRRVKLLRCDSTNIPVDNAYFDKAYSVHTIYFWRDPKTHLREIHRLIKSGGKFILGFRASDDPGFQAQFPESIYHIRSAETVATLCHDSGFVDIHHRSEDVAGRQLHWITAHKKDD